MKLLNEIFSNNFYNFINLDNKTMYSNLSPYFSLEMNKEKFDKMLFSLNKNIYQLAFRNIEHHFVFQLDEKHYQIKLNIFCHLIDKTYDFKQYFEQVIHCCIDETFCQYFNIPFELSNENYIIEKPIIKDDYDYVEFTFNINII